MVFIGSLIVGQGSLGPKTALLADDTNAFADLSSLVYVLLYLSKGGLLLGLGLGQVRDGSAPHLGRGFLLLLSYTFLYEFTLHGIATFGSFCDQLVSLRALMLLFSQRLVSRICAFRPHGSLHRSRLDHLASNLSLNNGYLHQRPRRGRLILQFFLLLLHLFQLLVRLLGL